MKSSAIVTFTTLLASALAAPACKRQASSYADLIKPVVTTVTYRVSNLEDPSNPLSAETTLEVNGGTKSFSGDDSLVGAGPGRLNTMGNIPATRIDIISSLENVHCNLYDGNKHILAEFSEELGYGADFDGVEGEHDVAVMADYYSLLCYWV